jgi:dienelactone hydrolase
MDVVRPITSLLCALAFSVAASASASDTQRASRELEHVSIGNIPVVVSPPARIDNQTRVVVLFHGFGSPGNPDQLADAVPLAGTSFIGVYVAMPLIGQRMAPGGVDELRRVQTEDFVNGLYFRSIATAVDELPQIVEYVTRRYGADTAHGIGVFGFSAGGSAALLSLTRSDVPIAAVVAVNTPLSLRQNVAVWERELKRAFVWDEKSRDAAEQYDVIAHADAIARRKPTPSILLLQGDQDEYLATQPMSQTCDALKKSFVARGSAIECDVLRGISHNFASSTSETGGQRISETTSIARVTQSWFTHKLGG